MTAGVFMNSTAENCKRSGVKMTNKIFTDALNSVQKIPPVTVTLKSWAVDELNKQGITTDLIDWVVSNLIEEKLESFLADEINGKTRAVYYNNYIRKELNNGNK
jgi:hypothetical protein